MHFGCSGSFLQQIWTNNKPPLVLISFTPRSPDATTPNLYQFQRQGHRYRVQPLFTVEILATRTQGPHENDKGLNHLLPISRITYPFGHDGLIHHLLLSFLKVVATNDTLLHPPPQKLRQLF